MYSKLQGFLVVDEIPVVVSGNQGSVLIDTIDEEFVDDVVTTVAGVGRGGRPAASGILAQLLPIHSLATTQIERKLQSDQGGQQSINAKEFH
jgi:hypothetical protein